MTEPTADPFAGVSTEAIVELVLAGEALPGEARQHLYNLAAGARRDFPAYWAYRFAEAYKTGLRERWLRELKAELDDEPRGGTSASSPPRD